jgi:ABC-type lipoprotein release transport system permease subunit
VVRLLAGRGGLVVAAGLIVGWVASLALSTVLEADLHGVGASDLPTRAAVAAVLVGVCTAALWWPARRAARVDPARVLREE